MTGAWVLYIIIFFVNGETIVLENDERFKTEDHCWAAGMIKGPHLLEKTSHIFGVPVRGSFTCQRAGQNA